MRRYPRPSIVGLLVAVVALAGCFQLKQPAPQISYYRLAYSSPTIAGAALPVTLQVVTLDVAALYDHEPIVYSDNPYSTGSYFYHRWSANPGSMVTDLLARDFTSSGLYRAVQQQAAVLPPDYQLSGTLASIEERASGRQCAAHLEIRVLVSRVRGPVADAVVMRQTYTADDPCTCNDVRSLAEAMSHGLAGISERLQRDVYAAIAEGAG